MILIPTNGNVTITIDEHDTEHFLTLELTDRETGHVTDVRYLHANDALRLLYALHERRDFMFCQCETDGD